MHTEYVDNFVGLSQQESVARNAAERVSGALVEAGLPVHPVTYFPGDETLGTEYDPVRPVVGVSRCLGLGERGRNQFCGWSFYVSGSGAERTPTLCSLRFISSRRPSERALMGSDICELRVAASLIFLADRDLSAWAWCSEVTWFDASPSCGAVVAASMPAAIVKEPGRYNDRWPILSPRGI